jgi:excisionase family DNA binding protein
MLEGRDKLYTIEEVAELLAVHPDTVRRYLRDKRMRGVKLRRFWRIPHSEFQKFLESRANMESDE